MSACRGNIFSFYVFLFFLTRLVFGWYSLVRNDTPDSNVIANRHAIYYFDTLLRPKPRRHTYAYVTCRCRLTVSMLVWHVFFKSAYKESTRNGFLFPFLLVYSVFRARLSQRCHYNEYRRRWAMASGSYIPNVNNGKALIIWSLTEHVVYGGFFLSI